MPTDLVKIAKKPLTPAEQNRLNEITRPGVKIDAVVAENVTYDQWLETTQLVCRGLAKVQLQAERLFPILGKLLVFAQEHEDLWKSKYDKWDNFLAGEVYGDWGAGRSTCYEAMTAVRRYILPMGLKVSDCERITRTGFKVLNRAIPKGQEKENWAKEVVTVAIEAPRVRDLEDFCESKGYLTGGEMHGAFLRLPCSQADLKFFEKFFENVDWQGYCETSHRPKMLRRAIEEATTEWATQGKHATGD